MVGLAQRALMERKRKVQIIDEEMAKLKVELRGLLPKSSIEKADYFYNNTLLGAFSHIADKHNTDYPPTLTYNSYDSELNGLCMIRDADDDYAPDRIFAFMLNNKCMFIFYYTRRLRTSYWTYGIRSKAAPCKFSDGYSNMKPVETDAIKVANLLMNQAGMTYEA